MARRLVKVVFELDSSDWHGHGSELLWVVPASAEHFQIENSPFFVTGIGYLDVVKAQLTEDSTIHRFEEIVTRGGHSTYMLLVEEKSPQFDIYWSFLEAKGCSYESMHTAWANDCYCRSMFRLRPTCLRPMTSSSREKPTEHGCSKKGMLIRREQVRILRPPEGTTSSHDETPPHARSETDGRHREGHRPGRRESGAPVPR